MQIPWPFKQYLEAFWPRQSCGPAPCQPCWWAGSSWWPPCRVGSASDGSTASGARHPEVGRAPGEQQVTIHTVHWFKHQKYKLFPKDFIHYAAKKFSAIIYDSWRVILDIFNYFQVFWQKSVSPHLVRGHHWRLSSSTSGITTAVFPPVPRGRCSVLLVFRGLDPATGASPLFLAPHNTNTVLAHTLSTAVDR